MKASDLLLSSEVSPKGEFMLPLMAYAAGDAFGVSYEFRKEKVEVDTKVIGQRNDWPLGGVSDDTLLSLITISTAEIGDPDGSSVRFLEQLRAEIPNLRGLGPTTRAALGMKVSSDEAGVVGNTNGGMMRTSLLGLAYDTEHHPARREMVAAVARATHRNDQAVACALIGSALYSNALASKLGQSSTAFEPLETVFDEVEAVTISHFTGPEAVKFLESWSVTDKGVSLDPWETLAAVVWVLEHSGSLLDTYRLSCELGGDTDTVAALSSGLFAASRGDLSEFFAIPWIDDVKWDEVTGLAAAAAKLERMRSLK